MNLYQHKVQYYETDKMGIVHHSNYVRWMEEARVDFLSQIGWDYDKLEASGIISPVTAIACEYKQSAVFPDVITVRVWVEEFKGIRLKINYEMQKADGTPVLKGHSEHCFLNTAGKVVNVRKEYPAFYEALVGSMENAIKQKI